MSGTASDAAVARSLGLLAAVRGAPHRVLLAVSGGPDSLALLLTFAARVQNGVHEPEVCVATLDHGLRQESAGEATLVGEICRTLGLPYRVLRWDRPPARDSGNMQAAAREARYRLLAAEARRVGASAVLTGHHLDDQIETHLLARLRGARGPALAAMRAWRDLEPSVVLLRPFLELDKAELVRMVGEAGLRPADDPTNADLRFQRAQVRDALARGFHDRRDAVAAIARAEIERRDADAMLAHRIGDLAREARLTLDDAGEITLDGAGADETGRHLLSRIVTAAGGGLYPPASDAVSRLAVQLGDDAAHGATLAGCRIARREGHIRFGREFGRNGLRAISLRIGETPICFDRRFDVDLDAFLPMEGARVDAFGSLGRGNSRERTLPVVLGGSGAVLAAHPALEAKLPRVLPLASACRLGWRLWADLPGQAPDALRSRPQITANPKEPVGKDLADTYLR